MKKVSEAGLLSMNFRLKNPLTHLLQNLLLKVKNPKQQQNKIMRRRSVLCCCFMARDAIFFFKFKSSNVVALGQILKCWIDVALVFLFHDALKGGNNIEIVNR